MGQLDYLQLGRKRSSYYQRLSAERHPQRWRMTDKLQRGKKIVITIFTGMKHDKGLNKDQEIFWSGECEVIYAGRFVAKVRPLAFNGRIPIIIRKIAKELWRSQQGYRTLVYERVSYPLAIRG